MEIRVQGLSKHFYTNGKDVSVLEGIDLVVPAQGIFTLLGPSGCGKTTLLRCIVGLETPDRGEIRIGDRIVWSAEKGINLPPEQRKLGMVFQSYAIWPHMTVFENVAYPLQVRKVPRDEIRRTVEEALDFVQLKGFEKRSSTKLSGGQQQRVALARALVAKPEVILFDEPLSHLDAKLRESTRKDLRNFLERLEITSLYVTHDRMEALALSDSIAVMRAGRIVEVGTPRKIYFESSDSFVADFIGRANLLKARVVSQDGELTVVESKLGNVSCRTRNLPVGAEATLCIRPEHFEIAEGGQPLEQSLNQFTGEVASLAFIGNGHEGEIRVKESLFAAHFDVNTRLREGDSVRFGLDPNHCLLLPI